MTPLLALSFLKWKTIPFIRSVRQQHSLLWTDGARVWRLRQWRHSYCFQPTADGHVTLSAAAPPPANNATLDNICNIGLGKLARHFPCVLCNGRGVPEAFYPPGFVTPCAQSRSSLLSAVLRGSWWYCKVQVRIRPYTVSKDLSEKIVLAFLKIKLIIFLLKVL